MPRMTEETLERLNRQMLERLRESFQQQTPEQRRQTVERVQRLLDRERERGIGARSALSRLALPVYGINPE
jgi:hypothetical protein